MRPMIDAAQLPHGARRPTLAEWYLRCAGPWGRPHLRIMAEPLHQRRRSNVALSGPAPHQASHEQNKKGAGVACV